MKTSKQNIAKSKTRAQNQRKKLNKSTSNKEANDSPLSICPVNGSGWCPYPFSVAQLKKRLKKKAANT